MNISRKSWLVGLAALLLTSTAVAQTMPAKSAKSAPATDKSPKAQALEERFTQVQDSLDQAACILAKGSAEAAKNSGEAPFSALQSVALQTKAPPPKKAPLTAASCPDGQWWHCRGRTCVFVDIHGACIEWREINCGCEPR